MNRNAVKAHYVQRWGDPVREAHFWRDAFDVNVYKFASHCSAGEMWIYATGGLSDHAMPGYDVNHRIELVCALSPARDEIAATLARIGLIPWLDRKGIGAGHTVTYDEPLWPGTEMCAVALHSTDSTSLAAFVSEEGFHVQFLKAIPLYVSEVHFKQEHSLEALFSHWQQQHVRWWDPTRLAEPG